MIPKTTKKLKLKKALDLLRAHKITIRSATKLAETSYVEMVDLAFHEGIDIGYSLYDLQSDIKVLET